ncbi:unnamed protein product [Thlaspi arvense]|uniref:Endonuclease/exonuclease/phosphatase domain-containing protein n=1 Tax=Thlaspi arvense TaxID=13288 RepID=A0AAU9SK72_THLAR|nr:unnamed protein product [Thlaspi arvense]
MNRKKKSHRALVESSKLARVLSTPSAATISKIKNSSPSFAGTSNTGALATDSDAAETDSSPLSVHAHQVLDIGQSMDSAGVPFVFIPDENIEAAKEEFKEIIFARFHGNSPPMGRIIGVVNALWARTGPQIFVHSPWSSDFNPEEALLTSAVAPVELRDVPYLLFNKESLSRIATALGKPVSLAPETEQKENFQVAKMESCQTPQCDVLGGRKEERSSPSESICKRSKLLSGIFDTDQAADRCQSPKGKDRVFEENQAAPEGRDRNTCDPSPSEVERSCEAAKFRGYDLKASGDIAVLSPTEEKNQTEDSSPSSKHVGTAEAPRVVEPPFYLVNRMESSPRIVVVWDPFVSVFIYQASAQAVTCGIFILAENVSFTVMFVYGFNQGNEHQGLWEELSILNATTPAARFPLTVIGDFNQIIQLNQHSNHNALVIDTFGMEEFNLAIQDADLFEAQEKWLPYTWWNNQAINPISKKIDHALINQVWASFLPDSYAEFLEPLQSDHAACLFRLPSLRRQVCKPFKFFHHVLKNFYKRHYSGISERVREQAAKVGVLQRALLTSPNPFVATAEHPERVKWQQLLTAESKYYRRRSRVRWADVGDKNTVFYHRTVAQRVPRNHIHFLNCRN